MYTYFITYNKINIRNTIIVIAVAFAAIFGIYWFQVTNPIATEPRNTVTVNFESNTENISSSTEENPVEVTPQITVQQPNAGAAQLVQDQAYCDNLGPQTGSTNNSMFFTSELESGDTITSGYLLRGCVKNVAGFYGNWGPFEGQVGSFELKASDGSTLAVGPLPTSGASNWLDYALASEHIPYEYTITFNPAGFTSGTMGMEGTPNLRQLF